MATFVEDYPIVTSLPTDYGMTNYGKRLCFHYSLTYDEVTALINNYDRINAECVSNNRTMVKASAIIMGAIGCVEGVATKILIAMFGYSVLVPELPDTYYDSNTIMAKKAVLVSIRNKMQSKGYGHVTISQVMEYRCNWGCPQNIEIWMPVGDARVPYEQYYWV